MNPKLIAVSASVLMAISISACSYRSTTTAAAYTTDDASAYTVSAYTAEARETAPLTGLNSDPKNPNGTPVPQVTNIYDF